MRPASQSRKLPAIWVSTTGRWAIGVKAWRNAHPEPCQSCFRWSVPNEGTRRGEPPASAGERVFEKSRGLLRSGALVAERCAHRGGDGHLSDHVDVPAARRGPLDLYGWRHRAESPTAARRRVLAEHVRRVFEASRQTSGCRRVAAEFNGREGIKCSVGLIADLMRELGLRAMQPRGHRRTTLHSEQTVDIPDLIERDSAARGTSGGTGWSATSPTCAPVRAGSTWPP
jgi:hypothetical protein